MLREDSHALMSHVRCACGKNLSNCRSGREDALKSGRGRNSSREGQKFLEEISEGTDDRNAPHNYFFLVGVALVR